MVKSRKIMGLLVVLAMLLCTAAFAQNQPVTLKADNITYDSETGISKAEGNVTILQDGGEAKSERAEYNMNTKVGWLEGNVVAVKDDLSLNAQKVWIRDQNYIIAEGQAHVTKAGDSITAPRIDYWTDKKFAKTSGGWGQLSQADGSVLTADYLQYDMAKGEGLAENNVKLRSPSRNMTGGGDKATYTAGTKEKPGEFVLTGNAWLVQDGNKVMGNRLVVKSDNSESSASGNARLDIVKQEQKKANDLEATSSDNKDAKVEQPVESKDEKPKDKTAKTEKEKKNKEKQEENIKKDLDTTVFKH